jgi:nondiscriminating glutamyl-tRNA synthetase
MQNQNVRVRFAPSPTGHLHVGGARTCFFNWLFAKNTKGTLILRVEDTDQVRSTPESEQKILRDLQSLGLHFQEGPTCGGPFAPYRQSERLDIYANHAQELLKKGLAYPCFCPEELLTQKREAALKRGVPPHYDGTCRNLTPEQVQEKLLTQKASLRFKAPQKDYSLKDHVRGNVEFKAGMVGDFLITRTALPHEHIANANLGFPVYNFCCVVDDALMKITHVIRAEEHLSNTVRQLMLYEAFGWTPPEFAHISLILGTDRQKLSKRSGDVSVDEFLQKGYLPEALLNFLVLLGWSTKTSSENSSTTSGHPEIFSLQEMSDLFELTGLQKAAAVFDQQKLDWMNGHYIHHIPLDDLEKRVKPLLPPLDPEFFSSLIQLIRTECTTLTQFPEKAKPYLEDNITFTPPSDPASRESFVLIAKAFLENMNEDIDMSIKKTMQLSQTKGKAFFQPLRIVLTGQEHGAELKAIIRLLGKERIQKRIHQSLAILNS